jgi:hypothetical protein
MNKQKLEDMTDLEIWDTLRKLKREAAWCWENHAERYNTLREMIGEVEAEITRRDERGKDAV